MVDDSPEGQTAAQRAAEFKAQADDLARRGKAAEAARHYRDALELRPDYFEVHANLGNLLLATGRADEALLHYREAVSLRPDIAALHDNLGNALRISGEAASAVPHHEQALRLQPRLPAAHVNLGNALLDLGRPDGAIESFEQALQLAPEIPEVHCALGNARQELAQLESALAHYREAARLRPGFIEAMVGEFNILMKLGDREAARRHMQPHAGLRGKDSWITLAFSRLTENDHERQDSLAELKGLLGRGIADSNELGKVYFRLGDLCDELHSHAEAFEYYRRANELRPRDFRRDRYREYIDQLLTAFSRDRIPALPRTRKDTQLPVFIVGMPRSGKTLTEQMLASHPQITGAGELTDISEIGSAVEQLTGRPFPIGIEQLSVDQLDDMAERYLARHRESVFPGTRRVIDTMPGNIHFLGLIRMLFPRAHIIHCLRDPLDTCLECYFKNFRKHSHPYACDLGDLGFRYQHYRRLSQHWRDLPEFPLLEVQYEDLVQAPERIGREIVDFVGLNWDARCLEFHTPGTAHLTGAFEILEPINTHSIGHWKNYEQYIQPLVQALRDTDPAFKAQLIPQPSGNAPARR